MTFIIVGITIITYVWMKVHISTFDYMFVADWNFRPGTFLNCFGHESKGHLYVNLLTFIPFSFYLEFMSDTVFQHYPILILIMTLFVSSIQGLYCLIRKTDILGLSGAAYAIMAMVCIHVRGWTLIIVGFFVVAELFLAIKSLFVKDNISHFAHLFGLAFGMLMGL